MAGEWKLRLDDETRARWDAAAAEWGTPLAEYVRVAVEEKIEGRQAPPLKVVPVVLPTREFRGPDPKVKDRPPGSGRKR